MCSQKCGNGVTALCASTIICCSSIKYRVRNPTTETQRFAGELVVREIVVSKGADSLHQ